MAWIMSLSATSARTAHIAVSPANGSPSARVSRIVPASSAASCGAQPNVARRIASGMPAKSFPSMNAVPGATARRPRRLSTSVVLPVPDAPISATLAPAGRCMPSRSIDGAGSRMGTASSSSTPTGSRSSSRAVASRTALRCARLRNTGPAPSIAMTAASAHNAAIRAPAGAARISAASPATPRTTA